jgi:hypothetical protein
MWPRRGVIRLKLVLHHSHLSESWILLLVEMFESEGKF